MKPSKEKTKKNKSSLIATVIFIIILIFLVSFICIQSFAPKTAITAFGYKSFLTSNTKSMEPTLKHNDMVFIIKHDFNDLYEGDIITYWRTVQSPDGKIRTIAVTHRIIEVVTHDDTGERAYRTKGDNNNMKDTRLVTIDGADSTYVYFGKLAGKSTFLGQLSAFFKSPFGIGAIVLIALTGILVSYIAKKPNDNE